jgi:hypothetical protein
VSESVLLVIVYYYASYRDGIIICHVTSSYDREF